MTFTELRSSNIKSAALVGDTLHVRFKCGACKGTGENGSTIDALNGNLVPMPCAKCDGLGHTEYRCTELPPDPEKPDRKTISQAHAELMSAPSAGAYYSANIRGKFATERV